MTKEDILVRTIIGPTRVELHPLACAIKRAEELMFVKGKSIDDIQVTKDIYPFVAEHTNRSYKAAARQIERTSNLCWDNIDQPQKMKYIGKVIFDIHAPRDIIFYLAYYCYFGKPYYEVMETHPELML